MGIFERTAAIGNSDHPVHVCTRLRIILQYVVVIIIITYARVQPNEYSFPSVYLRKHTRDSGSIRIHNNIVKTHLALYTYTVFCIRKLRNN